MNIRSQAGFTLLEFAIALGIGSVITLGGVAVVSQMQYQMKDNMRSMDSALDKNLTNRYLFSDLQKMQLSYNFLSQRDDRGKDFFLYFPDDVTSQSREETRTLTLDYFRNKTEVRFVVPNKSHPMPYPYFPHKAYDVGKQPSDLRRTASLEFKGLNHDNAVVKLNKDLWKENNWILLKTPVWINDNGLPRQLQFLGSIRGGRLTEAPLNLSIYRFDPQNPRSKVATPDYFFRHLPTIGGGAPLVLLRQVSVVSYKLINDGTKDDPKVNLYRINWHPSFRQQDARKVLVGQNVKQLRLHRRSIASKIIKVDLEFFNKRNSPQ